MKNKKLFIVVYLLIFFFSCKSSPFLTSNKIVIDKEISSNNDSYNILFEAKDLSENMSRLSSKNDELLFIIYKYEQQGDLKEPLFFEKFVLDENDSLKKMNWKYNKNLNSDKCIVFCIEQDSETPIEQLDPIIRIHYKKIIKAYNTKNYSELERYIGDEDLIGVKIIDTPTLNNNNSIKFNFEGIYKLDRYNYQIQIQ